MSGVVDDDIRGYEGGITGGNIGGMLISGLYSPKNGAGGLANWHVAILIIAVIVIIIVVMKWKSIKSYIWPTLVGETKSTYTPYAPRMWQM